VILVGEMRDRETSNRLEPPKPANGYFRRSTTIDAAKTVESIIGASDGR